MTSIAVSNYRISVMNQYYFILKQVLANVGIMQGTDMLCTGVYRQTISKEFAFSFHRGRCGPFILDLWRYVPISMKRQRYERRILFVILFWRCTKSISCTSRPCQMQYRLSYNSSQMRMPIFSKILYVIDLKKEQNDNSFVHASYLDI